MTQGAAGAGWNWWKIGGIAFSIAAGVGLMVVSFYIPSVGRFARFANPLLYGGLAFIVAPIATIIVNRARATDPNPVDPVTTAATQANQVTDQAVAEAARVRERLEQQLAEERVRNTTQLREVGDRVDRLELQINEHHATEVRNTQRLERKINKMDDRQGAVGLGQNPNRFYRQQGPRETPGEQNRARNMQRLQGQQNQINEQQEAKLNSGRRKSF